MNKWVKKNVSIASSQLLQKNRDADLKEKDCNYCKGQVYPWRVRGLMCAFCAVLNCPHSNINARDVVFCCLLFWGYHARKDSFNLERERGWVLLSNLVVYIIFIQLVCSFWGKLDKTFIVGRGNKEFTESTGSLQMWPL